MILCLCNDITLDIWLYEHLNTNLKKKYIYDVCAWWWISWNCELVIFLGLVVFVIVGPCLSSLWAIDLFFDDDVGSFLKFLKWVELNFNVSDETCLFNWNVIIWIFVKCFVWGWVLIVDSCGNNFIIGQNVQNNIKLRYDSLPINEKHMFYNCWKSCHKYNKCNQENNVDSHAEIGHTHSIHAQVTYRIEQQP